MFRIYRSEGDGGGGGTTEGTTAPETANIEKTGWLAAVSDDVFNAHKEELSKHGNISAVLKEHFNDKAKYADAIIKPKDNASKEEVALYKERMGIPLDANGYQFDALPEGATENADFEAWYRAKALEMNLDADQGKKFFGAMKQMEADGMKAQKADLDKKRGEAELAMRAEYGSQYDAVLRKSALVAGLGGPEFEKFLDTSGLGSHPDFLRGIGRIAHMVSEDSLGKGQPGGSGTEKSLADRMYPDQNK